MYGHNYYTAAAMPERHSHTCIRALIVCSLPSLPRGPPTLDSNAASSAQACLTADWAYVAKQTLAHPGLIAALDLKATRGWLELREAWRVSVANGVSPATQLTQAAAQGTDSDLLDRVGRFLASEAHYEASPTPSPTPHPHCITTRTHVNPP